ncbi:MAG: radical SAM family heme chaperone HemW [Sedimentisphaerales bacterium]|nr:radical SAM family heme chaperone HemW [Sedimentisphaerales bacterium]
MTIKEDNISGLYVHIPFCTSKCAYCNFYSEPVSAHDTYRLLQAMRRELSLADTSAVRTVYIGGGSPSCLPAAQLAEFMKTITDKCHDITEFTVECNPCQAAPRMLENLRELGVNRLSIGAQSFNDDELNLLGRIHNSESVRTAVYQARQAGFENISLDLIFAICGSTQATWQASLEQAIALNPEHISAYSLTLEASTPLAQEIEQGKYTAVDELTDRAMYEQAIETLTKAGYEHYEISNFAKSGFECRHNMGCWQNRPYIGIGPSASSSSGTRRTRNFSDIKTYIKAIESDQSPIGETVKISDMDRICETAVLNLRTKNGIDVKKFKQVTGNDPCLLFAEPVRTHCEQGLLKIENDRIYLTAKALPIADYVLCDFAAL